MSQKQKTLELLKKNHNKITNELKSGVNFQDEYCVYCLKFLFADMPNDDTDEFVQCNTENKPYDHSCYFYCSECLKKINKIFNDDIPCYCRMK